MAQRLLCVTNSGSCSVSRSMGSSNSRRHPRWYQGSVCVDTRHRSRWYQASFAVIPSVVCGDIMRHPRWNLARLGICTPCKLKNPICSWFPEFWGFYAACAEAVGQIDLFYGTGTHYDKNCWMYGEVSWLSARSPSEYAGKRLKIAVSKHLANHHRAAGKIPALYIQTSSYHIMQKIQKASRSSVPS